MVYVWWVLANPLVLQASQNRTVISVLEYLFLVFIFQFIKDNFSVFMSFSSKYSLSEINKLNVSNNYLLTGSFTPSYSGSEEYLKLTPFCGLRKLLLGRLAVPVACYYKS